MGWRSGTQVQKTSLAFWKWVLCKRLFANSAKPLQQSPISYLLHFSVLYDSQEIFTLPLLYSSVQLTAMHRFVLSLQIESKESLACFHIGKGGLLCTTNWSCVGLYTGCLPTENSEFLGNLMSLEKSGKCQGIFTKIVVGQWNMIFFPCRDSEMHLRRGREAYLWMAQSMN